MKNSIVLVCARGGSQGIPWKNLRSPYEGLNPYEILREKLNQSDLKNTAAYISSDSDEILAMAENYGFEKIKRPDRLATKNSRLVEVIAHAKDHLSLNENCQVVQISPVAPFISIRSLNNIYESGKKQGSASISVSKFTGNAHPSLAGEVSEGRFKFLLNHKPKYPRQQRKTYYYPNGCLFSRCSSLIKGNLSTNDLPDNPAFVVMDEIESMNLDDINDWNLAVTRIKGAK